MELVLLRTYYPSGTNGELFYKEQKLCGTIELPWQNNEPKKSCITEGRYALAKRYSLKFGWHYLVKHVEGRDLILIHPANDAQAELKGCIAPVTSFTGAGKGTSSRAAMHNLSFVLDAVLVKGLPAWLIIKNKTV